MTDLPEVLEMTVDPAFADGGWTVVFWRGWRGYNGGKSRTGLPVTFASKARAQHVGEVLLRVMQPEFARMVEENSARRAAWIAEQAKKPKPKPFRPTKRMPRIDAWKCGECEELYVSGEEGGPVYECSRCGQRQVEERRCENCHVFMSKVDSDSCPHCGAPTEEAGHSIVLAVRDPKTEQLHEVEA